MGQTILVVEDDPVMCRVLETMFTRHGFTVVTASGGGPALDLLLSPRAEKISLMLLDLIMPDIDGIEVLTKIRATNKELPVVVLTARGGIDSKADAMRAGANAFLVKPASPERIMDSIKSALQIGSASNEENRLKKKRITT